MNSRIRDMREMHNFTQSYVAQYLECDQSLYSKYERDERDIPLHMMIKLALFYNTSVDYLVRLTNEMAPYERNKRFSS